MGRVGSEGSGQQTVTAGAGQGDVHTCVTRGSGVRLVHTYMCLRITRESSHHTVENTHCDAVRCALLLHAPAMRSFLTATLLASFVPPKPQRTTSPRQRQYELPGRWWYQAVNEPGQTLGNQPGRRRTCMHHPQSGQCPSRKFRHAGRASRRGEGASCGACCRHKVRSDLCVCMAARQRACSKKGGSTGGQAWSVSVRCQVVTKDMRSYCGDKL